MHGLINRSIQCFLRDTYGQALWGLVALKAGLPAEGFEPMLPYPDALSVAVLNAAAAELGRPRQTLLEDMGTYLVSHPNQQRLRRLLRFGGLSFEDFLHSLEQLRDRGELAVPGLDLPMLELREDEPERFCVICRSAHPEIGHVLVGLLRAMADDYGALVLLEHGGTLDGAELIWVDLLDPSHAEGRRFDLSARDLSS